ncbi:MAG: hypothetical protein QXS27_00405 [Candidatus Jordarchaeaceae archaeon]
MSVFRPLGVRLIVVFLLLSAVGCVFVALGYWYALVYPPPFFYNKVLEGLNKTFVFTPSIVVNPGAMNWEIFFTLTALLSIDSMMKYQSAFGLFVASLVFYLVLCVVLVFVAWGLFKMKRWAWSATLAYAALTFISTFTYAYLIFPSSDYSYSLFNMNVPMLLLSLAGLDIFRVILLGLLFSITTAIPIIVYLFGDIKYEFQ